MLLPFGQVVFQYYYHLVWSAIWGCCWFVRLPAAEHFHAWVSVSVSGWACSEQIHLSLMNNQCQTQVFHEYNLAGPCNHEVVSRLPQFYPMSPPVVSDMRDR